MSLIGGLIIGSMLLYIVAIIVERNSLKGNLGFLDIFTNQDCPSFSQMQYKDTNKGKMQQIKFRIKCLTEKPRFFLSPLWIAKFTLRKEINVKLQELQKELTELQCQTF